MSGKPLPPFPLAAVAAPSAAKAAARPARPAGPTVMPGAPARMPAMAAVPPEARLEEAVTLWQDGRRADAEATAAAALGLPKRLKGADRARALTQIAEKLYFAGDYTEAAEAAGRALKADRTVLSARLIRAAALRGWGPLADAEAEARAAVKAAPGNPAATDGLVAVLLDQGRPEDAEKAVRALLARAPSASAAHALLGRLLRRRGRYDEAVAAVKAALGCPDAQPPRLLWVLGATLHDAGRYDEAIDAFRRSIALAPKVGDAHAALVESLQAAGRHAEAVEAVKAARKAVPGYDKRFLDLLYEAPPTAIPDAPADPSRVILVNGFGHYPAVPLGISLVKS